MKLIDIGCNLTHDSFDRDREAVIERAHVAGVVQMVVTGPSKDGSRAALELASKHPGELFSTAGVHPHLAGDFDDETERLLRDLSLRQGVVAVGETGLDYFRDFSPRNVQRDVFQKQGVAGFWGCRASRRDAGVSFALASRCTCGISSELEVVEQPHSQGTHRCQQSIEAHT